MISVVLTDEYEIVRCGIKSILSNTTDIVVRADASCVDDLAPALDGDSDDIIIIELTSSEQNGIEIIRRIRGKYAKLKILVLTADRSANVADRALKAGAKGYITKDSSATQIIDAIRSLARGRPPISEHIAEKLMFQLVHDSKPDGYRSLTSREMDVFLNIAQGRTCTEIARSLSLSIKTISTHKSRIMEKLSFDSSAELVKYAIAHKLVEGYVI